MIQMSSKYISKYWYQFNIALGNCSAANRRWSITRVNDDQEQLYAWASLHLNVLSQRRRRRKQQAGD